jgi:predicted phosphodiesterase
MKIGIVSDTHSNSFATKVVLQHMKSVGVEKKVHLGDIVGYGPRPSETLELTLENFNYIVKGNHDFACENEENSWGFNPQAKTSIDWTRNQLSEEEIEVLANLPYAQGIGEDIMFTHGSPHAPFDYITNEEDAKLGFTNKQFKVCFVGHTHVPFVWGEKGYFRPPFQNTLELNDYGMIGAFEFIIPQETRVIVNVGSVGQSRDGDNRATYAVYDTESRNLTIYKIPYSVETVVGQMQRAGFEDKAWQRLIYGR